MILHQMPMIKERQTGPFNDTGTQTILATERKDQEQNVCPYFDAVTLPHGGPHGHGDGWDAKTEVLQQGETETLPVILGGDTGEARQAPESKTTLKAQKKQNNTD